MKIISFKIDGSQFAIRMDMINEVMVYPKRVAKLPNSTNKVIGISNIRGIVTPIVNINNILGTSTEDRNYLIVMKSGEKYTSVPTYDIPRTVDINESDIKSDFFNKSDIIEGVVNISGDIISIIDSKSLF